MIETPLGKARYTPGAVVNWFLAQARTTKSKLDHIQLQRLMYFAHGRYLAEHNAPLVKEHAEAWEYGPIFPSVYHEYKKYGSSPLPLGEGAFMQELTRLPQDPQKSVFRQHFIHVMDAKTEVLLKTVWKDYAKLSANEISDLARRARDDNPWIIYRHITERTGVNNIDIPNEMIRKYFVAVDQNTLP